jgi:hypothetical protein
MEGINAEEAAKAKRAMLETREITRAADEEARGLAVEAIKVSITEFQTTMENNTEDIKV